MTVARRFAVFQDGKFVPGTVADDPQLLAEHGVPISEIGRIVVHLVDGVADDWERACGVCWAPCGNDLECAEHATLYGPAQKGHPIDVSIKDLWERGEI